MVGNDVVDLGDRETALHAMHPRFDERVFAAEELAWLRRNGNAGRWMLWAAKESAFKAAKKLDSRTRFYPRRSLVLLDDDGIGTVRIDERSFAVHVGLEADVCHAVAWSDSMPRAPAPIVVSGVRPVRAGDRSPRFAARRFALESLCAYLGAAALELDLVKEGRIPRLLLRGRPAGFDVSLSHHGRFVAFACGLTQDAQSNRRDC